MSQDWNIRAMGKACTATGAPFPDGATVVSRLVFDGEGYHREDFEVSQWTEALRDGAVSVWRAVFRAPPAAPEPILRKESIESRLRALMEVEDAEQRDVVFILAVMLERNRTLVERDVHEREDGMRIRVYEHRGTGEMFLVPDPKLGIEDLARVQAQVSAEMGWTREDREAGSGEPGPGGGAAKDSGEDGAGSESEG